MLLLVRREAGLEEPNMHVLILLSTKFSSCWFRTLRLAVQDAAAIRSRIYSVADHLPYFGALSCHQLPFSPVTLVVLAFVLASPCLRASSRRTANTATAAQCATNAAGDRRHFIVLQVPQAATHDAAV